MMMSPSAVRKRFHHAGWENCRRLACRHLSSCLISGGHCHIALTTAPTYDPYRGRSRDRRTYPRSKSLVAPVLERAERHNWSAGRHVRGHVRGRARVTWSTSGLKRRSPRRGCGWHLKSSYPLSASTITLTDLCKPLLWNNMRISPPRSVWAII